MLISTHTRASGKTRVVAEQSVICARFSSFSSQIRGIPGKDNGGVMQDNRTKNVVITVSTLEEYEAYEGVPGFPC